LLLVDFKGEANGPSQPWGTTGEQVIDHEKSLRGQAVLKIKELVSAEGIEPSTY
jgi:hypothetical protein